LRPENALSRLGEAVLFDDGDEVFQLIEFHHALDSEGPVVWAQETASTSSGDPWVAGRRA
jgi:hypothetical protein